MAGPIDWNHGLMLLLLTATCAPLTSSDSPACPSEILKNTTVDIKPAITNGATGRDPVHVSTEAKCLEKCCLANTASEDWNCTFVIFDSRKTGTHPNCYLFQCPTNDACPTKPSDGVTSHRLLRDKALPGNSHSKAKDSKPTYVDGNKKNELFLDLNHPEPMNQAKPLAIGSSMNKSITSKILVLAEDIVNHLDKIDPSLQEEKGQEEEEKKDSKPSSYQKPGIIFQLPTTGAAAANIMTTTQATTSTTTTLMTTTTTTLQMTTTTLSTTTTTTIPTTTLRATTPRPPPKPKTTPTTTTTSLPSTTTTSLPTTTTLPTTTSTVTTTLPITTAKITSLPTTTSTTLTTTTSTTTRLTTTSTTTTEPPLTMALTTTPVKTTKHPLVKLRPANSHLSKTMSSKGIRLTSTAESRVLSPEERPQGPLPKTRNSTAEGASKTNVSSPISPFVGVDSVTSSQNFNHGFNGYEEKIAKDLPNPDSKTGDRSGLLAALVFGVVFFAAVVFLITRRALEAMRRRHYSRLDYLINGMYIDS